MDGWDIIDVDRLSYSQKKKILLFAVKNSFTWNLSTLVTTTGFQFNNTIDQLGVALRAFNHESVVFIRHGTYRHCGCLDIGFTNYCSPDTMRTLTIKLSDTYFEEILDIISNKIVNWKQEGF